VSAILTPALLMQWEDDEGKHRQSEAIRTNKNTGLQNPLLTCSIFIVVIGVFFFYYLSKLFA